MNTIEASICIRSNGKKITAIKALRSFSGAGLVESKNFVEGCDQDYTSRRVRMTAEQFGNMVATAFEFAADQYNQPCITYGDAKFVQPSDVVYDFTTNA